MYHLTMKPLRWWAMANDTVLSFSDINDSVRKDKKSYSRYFLVERDVLQLFCKMCKQNSTTGGTLSRQRVLVLRTYSMHAVSGGM